MVRLEWVAALLSLIDSHPGLGASRSLVLNGTARAALSSSLIPRAGVDDDEGAVGDIGAGRGRGSPGLPKSSEGGTPGPLLRWCSGVGMCRPDLSFMLPVPAPTRTKFQSASRVRDEQRAWTRETYGVRRRRRELSQPSSTPYLGDVQ